MLRWSFLAESKRSVGHIAWIPHCSSKAQKARSSLPLAEPLKNYSSCPSFAGMLPLTCMESQEDWCCVSATGSRWDVLWQLCSATAGWQMSGARQHMHTMTRVGKRGLGWVSWVSDWIHVSIICLSVLTDVRMFTIWIACWNIQLVIQGFRELKKKVWLDY